jgi:hypothetical protein
MSQARFDHPAVLDLGPGDVVRVRTAEEIFGTLDERGRLDGLPFMPEMVRHCGQTYPVVSRADKTCDSNYRLRRMRNTVHLSQLRCDGSAHDGCQAACLMYWKEAWLEQVPAGARGPASELNGDAQAFVERTLLPATVRASDDGEKAYRCQATEVTNSSTPLPGWRPDQYWRDVRNWGLPKVLRGLLFESFNFVQDITRRLVKHGLMPRRLLFREGRFYPFLVGRLEKSSSAATRLDLQPGDRVRIKSRAEIVDTIDRTNRNRGLTFDVEMLRYCGQTARVQARVNQLIDEQTGKMIRIKSDCLILENVVCKADFHRFCTKATYPYWREAWLEKIS